MSRSDILYVKGMNISDSEGDVEIQQDIWDDRKLNDAYDKAVKMASLEVAKRIAMSTNNEQNKTDHSRNRRDKCTSQSSSSKSKKLWKPGMACRAVYEGDGLEYEAYVMRIINDRECIVRFIGYDNSEIVSINSLKESLGKNEQAQQVANSREENQEGDAGQSKMEQMECGSDRVASPGSTEKSFNRRKKSPRKQSNNNQKIRSGFDLPEMPFPMPSLAGLKNFSSMELPMPPPPPMTLPSNSRVDSEDQAISSMLLSWYMSGYYTGLYQGLKRSKESRRNP